MFSNAFSRIAASAAPLLILGCATTQNVDGEDDLASLDDPRLGEPVDQVCGTTLRSGGGGYVDVGEERRGLVVGGPGGQHVLVFSRNCSDLGKTGQVAIFRNTGPRCRMTGEVVQRGAQGFGPTTACTIDQIYRWDADAVAEPDDSEASAKPSE